MADGYLGEIYEQPHVLATLAGAFAADHAADLVRARALLEASEIDRIVLTGMGGSLHSLYPMLLELGRRCPVPASLWDCSELVQQGQNIIGARTLLIAVSQSGESGEVVRLTETVTRPRLAISVTNGGGNTLADWSDINVRTNAGPERTASTKTYTAGLGALTLVTAALLGRDIGAQIAALQTAAGAIAQSLEGWKGVAEDVVAQFGADAPVAFVGRGANLATAAMGALLTNEASKLASTALSGGQFRHGPIELVREGFCCIIFASAETEAAELDRRLADTVVGLGGRCAWVTAGRSSRPAARAGEVIVDMPVCEPSCLPILNIVPVQLLQVPLATARGFEVAQFLNASKVTTGQ